MHKNSKYHIIYQTLDKLGIKYQCLQHNPIMTMEEGAEGSSSNLVVISFLFRWFSSSSFLIL